MEQKKKMTNGQLLRRIQKSPLHLDLTKNTISVYFSDKGLRLTVDDTEGYALIATGSHTHYFQQWTVSGISRPFLYTKRVIEIANEKDCKTDNGYSFLKLLETLKAKEDKAEYNIVVFYEWWLQLIFAPLYSIGETETESFLVYEAYLHNIARNAVLLSEKTEDMTNKQFFDAVIKNMQEFIDGVDERVIFHKKTDEEVARENIEAVQEQELNETMDAQSDGGKD